MKNENRVTLEGSNENNNVTIIFLLGIWHVGDVGYSGCGMFGMWDVRDVRCGMFAGMWDVDLQNAVAIPH